MLHVAITLTTLPNKHTALMSEFFYCNRIVDEWNSLPNTVFSASLTSNFKMKLREVNLDRFLTIYGRPME